MRALTKLFDGRRWRGWSIAMWTCGLLMLALPAIVMQFSSEVDWDETDFIVMGAIIFAACAMCELAASASSSGAYRLATISAVGAAFLTVWSNLAVGMIGSEDNPYNLLFGAVVAVALSGAILVRFNTRGLGWVMLTVAVAQALVATFGYPSDPRGGTFSMIFAVPWCASAALFWSAARQQAEERR